MEMRHSDNDYDIVDEGYLGECFSSTTRGKSKGVRFAPASEVLHNPDRWDYIEVEVEDWLVEAYKYRLEGRVGRKYDFLGVIAGFSLPVNVQDEKKDYCSELISWVAWLYDALKKWHKRISPRRLAKVLAQKHGEPKSLV